MVQPPGSTRQGGPAKRVQRELPRDGEIAERLKGLFDRTHHRGIRKLAINVHEGVVRVSGEVTNFHQKSIVISILSGFGARDGVTVTDPNTTVRVRKSA